MAPELRQAITSSRPSFWMALLAFVTSIAIGLLFLKMHRELPFDSARWKNEEDTRPRMVRDLFDNHNLVGKTREFVHAKLGVPMGRDSVENDKYIYWAGTDGVIDDMWLKIEFDNEIVVSMHHVPD